MVATERKSGYLPSLDGWRCVAILVVMWVHDTRSTFFGYSPAFYQGLGGYGVYLFFAISGVLIAWRIQEDERKAGSFSLKNFYIRRFFRIQPPQWVYLAFVAGLIVLHLTSNTWPNWWGASLLYENFLWKNSDLPGMLRVSYFDAHFWTLAIEEHFYLLVSLFFFLVAPRRRVRWLGIGLALLLIGQEVAAHFHRYSFDVSDRRTYWNLQYLLFGSFAALLLRRSEILAWAQRWLHPWVAFAITPVLMTVHHLLFLRQYPVLPKVILFQDHAPLWYAFTFWIVATMLHPRSWTTRFLELRPLRFIGRISYSLYLWHIVFFGAAAPTWCSWPLLNRLTGHPVRYIASFVAALLSYYLVEKPMIRLGHRLAPPATPGHRDLGAAAPTEPSSMPSVAIS